MKNIKKVLSILVGASLLITGLSYAQHKNNISNQDNSKQSASSKSTKIIKLKVVQNRDKPPIYDFAKTLLEAGGFKVIDSNAEITNSILSIRVEVEERGAFYGSIPKELGIPKAPIILGPGEYITSGAMIEGEFSITVSGNAYPTKTFKGVLEVPDFIDTDLPDPPLGALSKSDFFFLLAKEIASVQRITLTELLANAIKDEDEWVKREAALAFRKIGKEAIPTLINLFKSDWETQQQAQMALVAIKDPSAVELLILALNDNNSRVRELAAYVLGFYGDNKAVVPLISTLKDENSSVRFYAACALGKLKDPRAVEPLIIALKDLDDDVRCKAAWALGDIEDTRAIEPLIIALDDKSIVRKKVLKSLQKITGNNSSYEKEEWREWWQENKEKFGNK